MKITSTRKMHLLFAVVSFVLSFCGFSGMLEKAGQDTSPASLGIVFGFGGLFFLYCFIKKR